MRILFLLLFILPTVLIGQEYNLNINYSTGTIDQIYVLENDKVFKIDGDIQEIYLFSSPTLAKEYLRTLNHNLKPKNAFTSGNSTIYVEEANLHMGQ